MGTVVRSEQASGSGPQAVGEIRHAHRHDASRAIQGLLLNGTNTVLDLGCGDGHHSSLLGRCVGKIVDCDIELAQLAELSRRSRIGGDPVAVAGYVCGDALRLPFARGSFDRVICSLVLYLLPLEDALAEMFALMRPGGRAYVRVPMLAAGRARAILLAEGGLRGKIYSALQVWNGLSYAALGRQVPNRLMRHDRWACYVPRGRFIDAVARVGFRVTSLRIDYPRPRTPSIEAWIEKPQ